MMRMTMADMADLADSRTSSFRLENADSYLTPAEHVLTATRDAVGRDEFNSYLPLLVLHFRVWGAKFAV